MPTSHFVRKQALRLTVKGRWQDADAAWRRLLAMKSARPSDYVRFARAVEEHDDVEVATRAFRAAVSRFPIDPNVHRQYALHLLRRHRDEEACLAFSRACVLAPDDAVLKEDLARLWIDPSRERPVAVRAFKDRVPPSPAAESQLGKLFVRGTLRKAGRASRAGDWAASARAYRKVMARRPTYPHGYLRLGHALKETGDLAGAEAAYWRAVALSSRQSEPLLHLGHVLKLRGEYDASLAAYLAAWVIDPANAEVNAELEGQGYSTADLALLVDQRWGEEPPVRSASLPEAQALRPQDPAEEEAAKLLLRPPLPVSLREKAVKADLARALAVGER